MVSGLINANPVIYEKKQRRVRRAPSVGDDEHAVEPIDQIEVFDNICGNGSWIAPEDEEAILAPGMAPLLETKINTKKPKISNYAFGSRDGSSAGDALRESTFAESIPCCNGFSFQKSVATTQTNNTSWWMVGWYRSGGHDGLLLSFIPGSSFIRYACHPAVLYMLIELAEYSVGRRFNCGARKLARTPRL